MRFWDASAIVPLVFGEPGSELIKALYDRDRPQTVWCLTGVEVASALARRAREGLSPATLDISREQYRWLAERWTEVTSLAAVRSRALRLVNTHPLRAADAEQLGAALVAADERPESLPFVCLDERLRDAARREGFTIQPA